jgi:hypothetical protein
MAYLVYNGVPIYIKRDNTRACTVCITDIYKAAGRPKNKAPTNFKISQYGREQIKHFEKNRGTWVWKSRTGKNTEALIYLGYHYLIYLGDQGAANALREVYETGRDREYNNLIYNTNQTDQRDDYLYYIWEFISTIPPWGWFIIFVLIFTVYLVK